jgi:hypothetical protein
MIVLGLSDTLILAVEIIRKSNIKIVERGKIDTPNTQIDDRSISGKKHQMLSSCLHLIETVYTNYGILHVHPNYIRNTTDDTFGAGNAYPYGAPRGSREVIIAQVVLLCVVCFRQLMPFSPFYVIVLSVSLRFTASDYPFDILNLFIWKKVF